MVAITVILAAVIAAFVLGLGDTNESAPSVTFDYDYTEDGIASGDSDTGNALDTVEIEVTSGETLDTSLTQLQFGDNTSISDIDADSTSGSPDYSEGDIESTDWETDSSASAGDSIVVVLGEDASAFELDLIFTAEDGGSSSRIGGTTGPDA